MSNAKPSTIRGTFASVGGVNGDLAHKSLGPGREDVTPIKGTVFSRSGISGSVSHSSSAGGTKDHSLLNNRSLNDQHPISAITGLKEELDGKQSVKNAYDRISKLNTFLYEVDYTAIDYDYAKDYFSSQKIEAVDGACSVLSAGDYVARNYDWHDDWEASFHVRTSGMQGRKAVHGVCSMPALTIQLVDSLEYNDAYKLLPFFMNDGINEDGLFAEMNVVPYIEGQDRTVPLVEKRDSVCSVMLVRYILDNFSTVDGALEYLQNYVEIYLPRGLADVGYDIHLVLRDAEKTIVMEFANGGIVADETNVSTNFRVHGVNFNEDGSVDIVENGGVPTSMGIEEQGSGLERWNILVGANVDGYEDIVAAIQSVNFTNAYTETAHPWYSEFVGGAINVDTPPDDSAMIERLAYYRNEYEHRSKDNPTTWNSSHTCVYNFVDKSVAIAVQEENKFYELHFNDSESRGVIPTNVSAFTNDSGYLTLATLPKYGGGVH